MKLRTFFALDAAVCILLALGFLLGPSTVLKFLGLSQGKTEVLLAQIFGAALVGFGTLAFMSRNVVDTAALQATLWALVSFSAIGFIVSLLGVMAQVTRAGGAWVLVILFLASAVGYAYFQFAGPRE